MRLTARRTIAGIAMAAAASLTLAACGGLNEAPPAAGPEAQGGSLAKNVSLKGQSYTVGSKDFDEQLLLCEIAIAALQSVGAEVTPKCDFGGTNPTRQALLSGAIDMYWGYTGTAWISFFKEDNPIPDRIKQYEAVKERDLKENQIVWLHPSQFNNTYAFAVKKEKAEELGLQTLEDMAKYVNSHQQEGMVCVESEYKVRNDGLPGLEQAYDFKVPEGSLKVLQTGAIYEATGNGSCMFGEMFTTDGRIVSLGLKVLDDPKQYHPLYNAAISIRKEAYDKAPQIGKVFEPIAEALDYDTMLELVGKVSAENQPPAKVARDWLKKEGFIGASEG